jgi:hypothetical protein
MFAPRTKLKIFQFSAKFNMIFTAVNLACILLMTFLGQPVPTDLLLTCILNAVCWFIAAGGIDLVKQVHGLDDKGNFSFKSQAEGQDDGSKRN